MLPIELDARLVEDAVMAAVQDQPKSAYWAERNRVYALPDETERDRAFSALHRRHFEALDLAAPLRCALTEQPRGMEHVQVCRVSSASSARDEGAELFVARAGEGGSPRWIVLRVRPASFSAPEALLAFLRHELQHIADMLDPAFGYDPAMPEVEGGAMRLKLVISRYRVLWDTVIDGRLLRSGHAPENVRDLRLSEFERAFPMLGEHAGEAFERWFENVSPTHAALLDFALDPRGAMGLEKLPGSSGVCPLCNCPGALVFRQEDTPSEIARAVLADFPGWRSTDGMCAQCEELYRSRVKVSRQMVRDYAPVPPRGLFPAPTALG